MTGADVPLRWSDRGFALRDRLLASPRFRHWAARRLFARPIARRRARDLFDLTAGFVYSQVLYACVRLRLFDVLYEGPQTIAALARRLALPEDATHRLLDAAVSLRLAARRGNDRYGLGTLGAAMVGNRAVAAMVEHHAVLYADLADPVGLLRSGGAGTALARYWPYAGTAVPAQLPAPEVAAYTALMAASQPLVVEEILAGYDFGRHDCVLDIGGGDGTFLVSVARRWPGLKLQLFDLPAVAACASARFEAAGLAGRAHATGGDFRVDALPAGADVICLVRVIHDHDDGTAQALMRAACAALPVGGTLLLAEPMSGTPGALPMGDAYFGFYLLAMGRGRPRTAAQLRAMLHAAGFGSTRVVATAMPLQTQLIVARRGGP
jgi:demethylspheroidene O-methyltransferase